MLRSLLMSRYLEMSSKFGRVFMAISGMVMAGVAIAPAPAQAAAKLPPLGKTVWPLAYNKSYCAYNQGRTRAIKVQLSGKLQYTRTVEKFNKNIRVMFHDPAVVDPKLSVTVLTKCSNGKKVKIDRIFAVQSWYAWKCGNISVSVKSPWGKERSNTFKCKNQVPVAYRRGDTRNGSALAWNEKDKKASWNWGSSGKSIGRNGKICMNLDVYTETTGDAIPGRAFDVCVPASYKAKP
jgi:hypothetical protein